MEKTRKRNGGNYSDDPAIREAAKRTEIHPWADKIEGEVIGQVYWRPGTHLQLHQGNPWLNYSFPIPEKTLSSPEN